MNRSGSRARVERGLDLGQHLLDRDDLLARQVAAAVRKHLVADEQAGDARRLERAHHLPHIVDAAEAGVGVDIDRDFDRGADARVVVGIVAHVGLAHVGLRQHAADRGIAAGHDRLEAFGLDDARRQRVIGARHQHQPLAGHDGAEFLSGVHGRSHSARLLTCRLSRRRLQPRLRRRPCASPNATISSVCLSVSPISSSPSSRRMRSAGRDVER